MREEFLVTGFGPFMEVDLNPSQLLAESCGLPFRVLDVSFSAVEKFIEEISEEPPKRLLMLGVHRRSAKFRIERMARNQVGAHADVEGVVRGPGPIAAEGVTQLKGRLWPQGMRVTLADPRFTNSLSAGSYLCNFIYYQAATRLPQTKCGFLHVPSLDDVPIEEQQEALASVLAVLGVDQVKAAP